MTAVMSCSLAWPIHLDTSALHAAAVVSSGRPVIKPDLVADLAPHVRRADEFVSVLEVNPHAFWNLSCAVSLIGQGSTEIATLIQRKMLGTTGGASEAQIAEHLRPILQWGQSAFPDLLQSMRLRKDPLKTQWEARGPGLLHFVARLTAVHVIPPAAQVALVQPIAGGDGAAHLDFNSIRFEAVLANALPQLPEVVRMAWLISQLQIDLPANSESLDRRTLPWLAAVAMLPPTLAAAELVELAHADQQLLSAALDAWVLPAFPGANTSADTLAAVVWNWWRTYERTKPPWPVALAALDRLL